MPWRETCVVNERTKFIVEWEERWQRGEGRVDVAELSRRFGISRQTAYVWIRRYVESGRDFRALEDRSSRPATSPTAVGADVVEMILAAKQAHPRWGPRMLVAWLADRHPGRVMPSSSTARRILERHGMVSRRKRRGRRRAPVATTPFSAPTSPNGVWCIDFKGAVTTGDGVRCGPLTLLDAYSRFCLRCELLDEATSDRVMHVLDGAFREYGLPLAIRSDNGPPFASTGAGGLTRLAAWLLRLGIRLERIVPGKPQQNGRRRALPPHPRSRISFAAEVNVSRPAARVLRISRRVQRGASSPGARDEAARLGLCGVDAAISATTHPFRGTRARV